MKSPYFLDRTVVILSIGVRAHLDVRTLKFLPEVDTRAHPAEGTAAQLFSGCPHAV